MIYRDGYATDNNLRFLKCPKCGNEEYSGDAKYCRICGFSSYNECEGSPEYDNFGNAIDFALYFTAEPDVVKVFLKQVDEWEHEEEERQKQHLDDLRKYINGLSKAELRERLYDALVELENRNSRYW